MNRLFHGILMASIAWLGHMGFACAADPETDQPGRIAAFLADKEGKQAHDFPAWNEYRKLLGDTPASRGVFAEMLVAEPKLFAATGGDAERLEDLFNYRVRTLEGSVESYLRPGWPKRTERVTLAQMAAILFVDLLPETPRVNWDQEIRYLLCSPDVITDWEKGDGRSWSGKPGAEHLRQWGKPNARSAVIKRLLQKWATREGATETAAERLEIAYWFALKDAQKSLKQEIVQYLDYSKHIPDYVFFIALEVGDKNNRRWLEPILDDTKGYGAIDWRDLDTCPQRRDLALATIVQLSGQRPEDYGFKKIESKQHIRFFESPQFYLFPSIRERNRAFEFAAKNFEQLGLKKPPPYTPRFVFAKTTQNAQWSDPRLNSPDGTLAFSRDGAQGQFVEAATGKPVGPPLGPPRIFRPERWFIHCWSFSPDEKLLATGMGYRLRGDYFGRIYVWDVATGKQLDEYGGESDRQIGEVRFVTFSNDGKEIVFRADRFATTGK